MTPNNYDYADPVEDTSNSNTEPNVVSTTEFVTAKGRKRTVVVKFRGERETPKKKQRKKRPKPAKHKKK